MTGADVNTWWYGLFVVPLAITIVVGWLLAVWTGIFIARITAYDQAKLEALRLIAQLANLADAPSVDQFMHQGKAIQASLLEVEGQFVRLRQAYAASQVLYIIEKIADNPWGFPDTMPLKTDERNALLKQICDEISVYSKMVFDTRPSFYELITLRGYVHSEEPVPRVADLEFIHREFFTRHRINERRDQRQEAVRQFLKRKKKEES